MIACCPRSRIALAARRPGAGGWLRAAHARCAAGARCALVGLGALASLPAAAPAQAGDRALYDNLVQRIDEAYLKRDELDAGLVLLEAAEAAETAVPWLIVDSAGPRAVRLSHGERGPLQTITLQGPGLSGLSAALEQLEDGVRAGAAGTALGRGLPVDIAGGVTAALDRHSVVMTGQRLENFDERIRGKNVSIGALVALIEDGIRIKEVYAGGPAAEAGLRPQDRLLRVDGTSTLGLGAAQVSRMLRGDDGTELVLQIERVGADGVRQVFEVVLRRAEVTIPNVHADLLQSGVLHVQIDHFSDQTVTLVRRALKAVPAGKLNGVVLDVRGNGGGSMLQACRVADLFLKDGPVLTTQGPNGQPVESLVREFIAHDEGDEPAVPVVVLQDERSASASEILAGALVMRERAVVVGGRSHGKGTVQKVYTLRGGEEADRVRLKLTVAEYRLPGDVPIAAGVGLAPDLWVEPIVLDQAGASFPEPEPDEVGVVAWLDERKGWRGTAVERGDQALAVAEGLTLRARRATDRQSLLIAAEAEANARARHEDDLLVEALAARGIDWRRQSGTSDSLPVKVALGFDASPRSGQLAELRASVENTGEAPLYRVLVRVQSDERELGLDGVVLAVGYLPPGENGLGSAMVRVASISTSQWTRLDGVAAAAGRPDLATEPQRIQLVAPPMPDLAVVCRTSQGPSGAKVSVEIENLTDVPLTNLRLKLVLPEGAPVELLRSEATLAKLGPRARAPLDLPIRPLEGATRVQAEARIYADPWGRVLTVPLDLAMDGRPIQRRPPQIGVKLPLLVATGPLSIKVELSDDRALRRVTAWLDDEKIAYAAPNKPKAELPLRLDLSSGQHRFTVEVEDDDGILTRRVWRLLAEPPAGEDSGRGEDLFVDEQPG